MPSRSSTSAHHDSRDTSEAPLRKTDRSCEKREKPCVAKPTIAAALASAVTVSGA